ncbi:MAG TPA: AAA family ATPase [Chloroflexota bacterium]|nr:AAA family ATPase [Chloroflexota bacterium]
MDGEEPAAAYDETPELRLYLLGGFRAESCGAAVPTTAWQRPTARTLVKMLAVAPGHTLHREQLEEYLWPDVPLRGTGPRLNKMVHMARHALEPRLRDGKDSLYLRADRDVVALDHRRVWIDADHFEHMALQAPAGDIPRLRAAVALYGGTLLPEDLYADWAEPRRETLGAVYRRLLLALADALHREGEYARAAHRLQMVLEVDPAAEEVHRRLMRLYILDGQRHLALRQYEACCRALRDELDIEPDAETQALYRDILTRAGSGERPVEQPREPLSLPAPVRRAAGDAPLLGRERALNLLTSGAERASEGRGGLVLVAGEGGVGKSRLVAELARLCFRRGMAILWGINYEQERVLPYGPFAEALEGYLSAVAGEEQRRILGVCPDLLQLVPSLSDQPSQSGPRSEGRGRLFASVVRALDDLAERQLILIVIEDLHAAGEETLQLLHHLARLARDRRWLLVATYREEDVRPGSPLQRFSADVSRDDFSRRLDLGRLARTDCEELVRRFLPGGSVDPTLLAYVYGLSLGNPLFAEQLVRTLQEEGQLTLTEGHWQRLPTHRDAVPPHVRALIEARVAGMGTATRNILALAATAGMESSFAALAAAARQAFGPMSHAEILDALDEAQEARLLEEEGEGYVFRHPLMREALYTRLSRQRRLHLHASLAGAIEVVHPDDVEALAHHHLQANNVSQAILFLRRAGDRAAAMHANETAEQYYRDLLRLLDGEGRAREAAPVRERLAEVLTTLSRHDEAITVLEEAESIYQIESDMPAVARAAGHIGRLHGYRARPEAGVERVEATLRVIDEVAYPDAASFLLSTLAWLKFTRGERREILPLARRAAELAGQTENTRLHAETLTAYARALLDARDYERGWQLMDEAIRIAEEGGHERELATALVHSGIYRRMVERDPRLARHPLERALTLAERVGDVDGAAFILGILGQSYVDAGDWPAARVHLDRGVAFARAVGATYHAAYPIMIRALLAAGEGDHHLGTQLAREAIAIGRLNGNGDVLSFTAIVLADIALQQGLPDTALEHLENLSYSCREEAWAHVLRGDFVRAEVALVRHVQDTQRDGHPVRQIKALWVHALVLAGLGQRGEARAAFEEAIACACDLRLPYEEVRARCEYGRVLLGWEEIDAARGQLALALAGAQRLGASGYARRAECGLRSISAMWPRGPEASNGDLRPR